MQEASGNGSFELLWQDREIRFDTSLTQLATRRGELTIDSINSVEDTKGNNGERGSLIVTNLRLIWVAHKSSRTNLSIGFNTIVSISIRRARSKLRGSSQALYLMTKFSGSRFEFIFTSLVQNSPRLFTTTQSVLRAYETTKLYRDLKLRVSIVKDGQLILLPNESIYSQVSGVWNLSSDQGNLGTMFITSVRVVWHANLAQNFNVSMPYTQIKDVKVRSTKFGGALVIETTKYSGGYVLGFRIDPKERLQHLLKEITSLHAVFAVDPNFGVNFESEETPKPLSTLGQPRTDDDCKLVESEDNFDAIAAYYADEGSLLRRPSTDLIAFDPNLGLAIQPTPKHTSIDQLWAIVA